MHLSKTAKVVATLKSVYSNVHMTEDSINAYHMFLVHYDYETVMTLLPAVMRKHPDFCPNIPALVNEIDEHLNPAGSTAEAWEAIAAERKRVGTWHPPVFADPTVERVVKAIGWQTICATEIDDEGTLRAQVRDMYKAFARRAEIDRTVDEIGGDDIVAALREGRRPERQA